MGSPDLACPKTLLVLYLRRLISISICPALRFSTKFAFCSSSRKPSGADLAYMEELLAQIERQGVAAPAPIEQRWCASVPRPSYADVASRHPKHAQGQQLHHGAVGSPRSNVLPFHSG